MLALWLRYLSLSSLTRVNVNFCDFFAFRRTNTVQLFALWGLQTISVAEVVFEDWLATTLWNSHCFVDEMEVCQPVYWHSLPSRQNALSFCQQTKLLTNQIRWRTKCAESISATVMITLTPPASPASAYFRGKLEGAMTTLKLMPQLSRARSSSCFIEKLSEPNCCQPLQMPRPQSPFCRGSRSPDTANSPGFLLVWAPSATRHFPATTLLAWPCKRLNWSDPSTSAASCLRLSTASQHSRRQHSSVH